MKSKDITGIINNIVWILLFCIIEYCKENESGLLSKSICFISDDLKHDVNFVYKAVKDKIKFICHKITETFSKVHYFSDGCAGQYKNSKNFLNLCLHNSDFGVKCERKIFATSHGKSLCNGIGATVKQIVTKAKR